MSNRPYTEEIAARMHTLWSILSEADRQRFAQVMNVQKYLKNKFVYHEGMHPNNCIACSRVR